jgi:CBS domain-containing protein
VLTVGQVMTTDPICVRADSPVSKAAQQMAESGVGSVIVVEGDQVIGVCTDRDITVRVTATNHGPDTPVQHACSRDDLAAIAASMTVANALTIMRDKKVRRLPVLAGNTLVGIVSLGDLTRTQNPDTALRTISTAAPNR